MADVVGLTEIAGGNVLLDVVGPRVRICAVLMRPGAIVLTVIPYDAALAGAAALSFGATSAPEMLMIRPQRSAFIAGMTSSVSRRAAMKLSVTDSSQ